MGIVFKNNAKTTLASSLSNSATSATVTDGSVFPSLSAGEFFLVTFDDGSNNEICKCTARSGNTLTIVRAQESTTARAFSSGDAAEGRVTAGVLETIQENIAAKSANQTVFNTTTSGGATTYNIGTNPGVEANAMVFLNGVLQHHDTLSFSGTNLTFDAAPANGLALEVIIDNLINLQSSNLTVDSFTAADVSGSPQTDFTLSDTPAAETNLIVFIDGVFQDQDAYTISSNTLTITTGVIAGRGVTVYVINPVNIGTPSDSTVTSAKLSGNITMPGTLTVGANDVAFDSPTFVVDNANSRVGLGTASPSVPVDIVGDVKMSADLTVDTTTLVVDSSNNKVGIGTASPSTKLHLGGTAPGDSIIRQDSTSSGTNWEIGERAAGKWQIFEDDADSIVATFKSDGKVGVGTESPSTLLHLDGTSNHTYLTVEANSGVGNAIKFVGSNTWILGNDTASGVGDNNFALLDGSDIRFTVDTSGNLGIGTTTPQSLFQVAQPNGTMSHFGGIAVTNTHFSGISLGYTEAGNANYRKAAIVQEQIGDGAARGHMHLLVDTANDGNSAVLADAKLSIHGTSGNVGIGDSNPQHPLKVHLTNGEVAMFGSNGMNSPGQYAGIGLGQVLANNTTYQKVKLVAEGRNSGSYIQDFHILVDTVADPNSAVLDDAKLTIDGGTGAVTHPKQPSFNAYSPAVTSGDNTIIFGTERHDTGGDYNHTTGVFTAPVAGVYQFHVYILMDPGNNEYGRVLFRINNTGSTMEQYGDNLTYVAGQPAYFGLGLSLVLYMSANDNIRVHNSGQWPTYGSSYGAFSGHLIG